jgi:5-methyltetrahydrofolate--homocysteine methyltransferase
MDLLKKLQKKGIIILDGATGTNLFEKGLHPGEPPAALNLKNPDAVFVLQTKYIESGSDVILTNTFSANPINFKENKYKAVIREGIKIARRALTKKNALLGDVGPLGILIKPYGDGDFDEVYKIYLEIFRTFLRNGVKSFFIETFNNIIEAKAAFLAAREFTEDIYVSFTFQDNFRTLFGEIPEAVALTFEKLGAKGIGVNCTEPETAIEVLKKMAKVTALPLIAKPNAGKVRVKNGRVINSLSDEELAEYFKEFIDIGVKMLGGCCGTTPNYIRIIASKKSHFSLPSGKSFYKKSFLVSPHKVIEFDNDTTIIVGERLNPSGRKRLRESILKNDYTIYQEEAKLQEEAGAQAVDVNAVVPEIDEVKALKGCLIEVIKGSKIPVFIDTQNFLAADEAMRIYPGIGVYNSIPARKKELERFLPIVKKYGFKAVISLVGKKIPKTFEERIKNVYYSIRIAKRLGFPVQDMIFDPLVFSIATEPEQVFETMKAVEFLHKKGLFTILGISNISFGLPERGLLNASLSVLAIKCGVNFLIINPLDQRMIQTYYATQAIIKNKIDDYVNWVKKVEQQKEEIGVSVEKGIVQEKESRGDSERLINAIVNGDLKSAIDSADKLVKSGVDFQKIIDSYIFEAMKIVGDKYEKGVFFIPDLLKSAEATGVVLERLKERMKRTESQERRSKKTVVLATVKGDIHDIGKNIVGMVLESAGYEVVDLGKDVPAKKILEAVKKYKPIAVGLSALLTTTMQEMENVIKLLRDNNLDVPVIIGGPNVSEGFAKRIGAYAAAQNAFEGLKILKGIK